MSKGLKHRADNDPRAASLLGLTQVMGGADSQAALDQVLKAAKLTPTDKGLCTELFYGTLRYHLRLDWFLRQQLSKPEGLPPEMLLLLEQGMYEQAHTDIPAYASVDWAVGLVRGRFGQGLSKVANGVLRNFERNKKTTYLNPGYYAEKLGLPVPASREETLDIPEIQAKWYACPDWLIELWNASYSKTTSRAFMEAAIASPPQGIRLNLLRQVSGQDSSEFLNILQILTEQGAIRLEPTGWILPKNVRLPISNWSKKGFTSRQSPAAYAALFKVEPKKWPEPIWDACCGRGGKTLALLEQSIAVHTASDPHKGRLEGLKEDYTRLGLSEPPCPLTEAVTAQKSGFGQIFGTVLLDAPCSGLGTLSHRPEIRWRRNQDDLAKLASTQAEILEAAHRALKPESGNRIVYMTCTTTRAENQEQAQAFLAAHPEYRLACEYETPPDAGLGEFFYAAVLER